MSDMTFLPVSHTYAGSKNYSHFEGVVLVCLPKGLTGSSVSPLVTLTSPGNTGLEIVTGLDQTHLSDSAKHCHYAQHSEDVAFRGHVPPLRCELQFSV